MNAKELRIGNFIEYNGEVCEILGINKYGVEIKLNDGFPTFCDFKYIKEILITEEWHNKFGIKKNSFNSFEYKIKNKSNLYLTVIFTGDYVMIRQGEKRSIDDDVISVWNKDLTKREMYVHEWQNLYFALTNEEL